MMSTSPTVGSLTERLIRRFRFPEPLGTLSDLCNFSRISQALEVPSMTTFHSHLGWIHSKFGYNSGTYLTAASSLSQKFCPGSHPSIFVPQSRISRQGG